MTTSSCSKQTDQSMKADQHGADAFILADMAPQYQKPVACIGGCIGGFAAGFLWTAQVAAAGTSPPSDCIVGAVLLFR